MLDYVGNVCEKFKKVPVDVLCNILAFALIVKISLPNKLTPIMSKKKKIVEASILCDAFGLIVLPYLTCLVWANFPSSVLITFFGGTTLHIWKCF